MKLRCAVLSAFILGCIISNSYGSQETGHSKSVPIIYVSLNWFRTVEVVAVWPGEHTKLEYLPAPHVIAACWLHNYSQLSLLTDGEAPTKTYDYNMKLRKFTPTTDIISRLPPTVKDDLLGNSAVFDWSNDGRVIAYQGRKGLMIANGPIWQSKLVVKMPHATVDSENSLSGVSISPDGRLIALSREGNQIFDQETGEPFQDLWLVRPDGSGLRCLGHGGIPNWSPDSKHIVVMHGSFGNANRIDIVDATTGKRRTLVAMGGSELRSAVYNPDGTSLAIFGAYPTRNDTDELFLVGLFGGKTTLVPTGSQLHEKGGSALAW